MFCTTGPFWSDYTSINWTPFFFHSFVWYSCVLLIYYYVSGTPPLPKSGRFFLGSLGTPGSVHSSSSFLLRHFWVVGPGVSGATPEPKMWLALPSITNQHSSSYCTVVKSKLSQTPHYDFSLTFLVPTLVRMSFIPKYY